MKMHFLWAVVVSAVSFSMAARADGPQSTPVDLKTIAGSLSLSGSLGAGAALPSAAAAHPTPLPVVAFEKLTPFLPPVPEGWTAENPSGSVTDVDVFRLSTVSRIYIKGEDQTASVTTVTLLDAGGHQGYFEATTGGWKFNSQTAEGYDKAVEIDGVPGYEHFNQTANSGSLSVIVAKRFFVQIDVTNQEPGALREWLKKIDLKKLAELK
jgi:hypothetical protein